MKGFVRLRKEVRSAAVAEVANEAQAKIKERASVENGRRGGKEESDKRLSLAAVQSQRAAVSHAPANMINRLLSAAPGRLKRCKSMKEAQNAGTAALTQCKYSRKPSTIMQRIEMKAAAKRRAQPAPTAPQRRSDAAMLALARAKLL